MHFSMGALGRFHIRIKTWPRLIGSDVSYILFPKARRVAADHKNFCLIDKDSTAPIRCMPKNKQLFAFKQKHQTRYKRCSYFSTFRHLPMGNPRACRNVFFVRVRTILFCQPHIIPFADGREIFFIFANFMLSSFCRWTKRPLGADARCPVWDILGYFATILRCQPHDILFQAHDIFSLQMDQKTSGSGCKMPSLGSMQAAFLANIASLFNSHGRLVCFNYLFFCHSYCSPFCCHCWFVVVAEKLRWLSLFRLPNVQLKLFSPVCF